MLVQRKRFNQMEIQMDKFLAKKNPIFKQIAEPSEKPTLAAAQQNNPAGVEKQDYVFFGFGLAHPDAQVRYRLNGAILQLTLKSMYEAVRGDSWCLEAY